MNGKNNLDEDLKNHIEQFNPNKVNNKLLFHKFIMINEILDKRNKKQNPEMKSITKGQGRLIGFLKRKDGFSTKELSEILNISVTSLNETLNKLEQQNFIRKVPSPKDKRVLLVELTEEGRAIEFKNHEDIDIFDTLSEEEKENLNEYLNRLTVALHNKFKEENPEKYEKIIKNRKEIFEKYFKEDNPNEEWMQLMNCNKKEKCQTFSVWNDLNSAIDEFLENKTLFNIILGVEKPDHGQVFIGKTIKTTNVEFSGKPKNISKDDIKNRENNELTRHTLMKNNLQKYVERNKGNLPNNITSFLRKLFHVKIDWKKILRNSLQTILEKADYFTWAKPRTSLFALNNMPYLPSQTSCYHS